MAIIATSPEIRMAGFFTITAVRDGEVVNQAHFPNMIVDHGLQLAVQNSSDPAITDVLPIKVAQFGLGIKAPSAGDTSLTIAHGDFSAVGVVTSRKKFAARDVEILAGDTTTPLSYTTTTWSFTFSAGDVPQGDLGEIGIFGDEINGVRDMWAHALIKNDAGQPTTFYVDGTEMLYVRYELRKYIPAAQTGTVTVNAIDYSYTVTPFNVNSDKWNADAPVFGLLTNSMTCTYDSAAPDMHDTNAGTPIGVPGTLKLSAYVAGNTYLDASVVWEALQGNVSGGIVRFGGGLFVPAGSSEPTTAVGNYQVSFNPPLPKDDRHRLSVMLRYSLAYVPV